MYVLCLKHQKAVFSIKLFAIIYSIGKGQFNKFECTVITVIAYIYVITTPHL
jgi:hypothetical protein